METLGVGPPVILSPSGLIGSKDAVSLFISYCKKDLVWGEEKQPEAAKPG